jgi:hypothetical protein
MSRRDIDDIKIGLFCGLIIFVMFVMPVLQLYRNGAIEARKPREPFTLYIREIE